MPAVGDATRQLLRRSNFLMNVARSVRDFLYKWGGSVRTNYEIVNQLAAFAPNSAGSLQACGGIALEAARQTFPLMASLIETTAPKTIDGLFSNYTKEARELSVLFNQHGSDKSSLHDYHLLYAPILSPRRTEPLRILEIGLGTNNPDVVSTMGREGRPGASLRAFRDFLPNAAIFGADIDRRVLFEETRIKTYYVDQTRASTFDDLAVMLGNKSFDLIIDDGLHSPNANIATMLFALKLLKPRGYFVVEDISADAVPIWQVIAALLSPKWQPTLIQAKHGLLFVLRAAADKKQ